MIRKYQWIILLGLIWLAEQILLFSRLGVKFMADSYRYEECLLAFRESASLPTDSTLWYHGYTLFLLFSEAWGPGWQGVVFWQVLLSGLAIFLLARQIARFTQDKRIGYITSALLIAFVPLSSWNFYVLTESLFSSFVMLSLASVLSIQKARHFLLAMPLFLFAAWIRPHGMSLLVSIAGFALLQWGPKWSRQRWAWIGAGIMLLAILLADRMMAKFHLLEAFYSRGELIANYALVPHQPYQNLLIVPVPDPLIFPGKENSFLLRFFEFLFDYPLFFIQQVLGKAWWFVAHIRPYYSLPHNLFLLVFLLPIYAFAVKGSKSFKAYPAIYSFCLIFLSINFLAVSLTVPAWDGRFLIPLLPIIFMFGAVGSNRLFLQIRPVKQTATDHLVDPKNL